MNRIVPATFLLLSIGCVTPLCAEPDKFHITDQEKAACGADAISLCSSTYPDEDQLLACMKVNRPQLTSGCRVVFDAGLRKRHMSTAGDAEARNQQPL